MNRLPSWTTLALALLALCLRLSAAQAQTQAPKGPEDEPDTLILSDTLDYDDTKKESIFTGNVVMTRGLMTLNADRLVVREDAKGYQHGIATVTGAPLVMVRQENPEKFEVIVARGLRAEYNGQTTVIDLIGQATITKFICGKPFDTISGERVKYNQRDNTYQASGGPQSAAAGGRVRSLATPSAKAQAAVAACKAAAR
jgi:lipopolysaccharide export system protein LptA